MKILDAVQIESGEGWVLVFPRGKHFINKYEIVLDCNDSFFNSIKSWWEGSTFKKPYLDKGHEFNESYGDFKEMRITDKGFEMFLSLNEEGRKLLKSGSYQYLSPTFNDAADSTGAKFKNVIYTVSLVNSPALLVLDKIQDQIALSFGQGEKDKLKKGGSIMELRELIASKMSLSLAADDGSILAKIEELLNAGATIEELKSEIASMKKTMEEAKGELAAVKGAKDEAEKMLSALTLLSAKTEAGSVVDEAIKLGQYHPSLKEMKVELYLSNKDSVVKELSIIPKKDAPKQSTIPGDGSMSLDISDEDKAILLDAGYDLSKPEDMKLAKEFIKLNGGK